MGAMSFEDMDFEHIAMSSMLFYVTVLEENGFSYEELSWLFDKCIDAESLPKDYYDFPSLERSELVEKGIRGCVGLKIILHIILCSFSGKKPKGKYFLDFLEKALLRVSRENPFAEYHLKPYLPL